MNRKNLTIQKQRQEPIEKQTIKYNFPKQTELDSEDLEEIIKRGCILCGNIGSGKTHVAQNIYNALVQPIDKDLNILVFDTVGNWVYGGFKQTKTLDDLRGTQTFNNNEILYLRSTDKEERLRLTKLVAETVFKSQQRYCRASWTSQKWEHKERFVFILEEANTLFTTKSINKGFWLDFIAFARNYNISGVYILQRLSDSSTKIVERIPNFIIGQTRGFNDKLRIKRMLPDKETRTIFEHLNKHEFLCILGNKQPFILQYPKPKPFKDLVKDNLRDIRERATGKTKQRRNKA